MGATSSPADVESRRTALVSHSTRERVTDVLGRVPGVVWIALIALLARLLYGSGYVWYDALYHLVWANDLVHGHLPPDLTTVHSPTPHPLALLVSLLASRFGSGAFPVMEAISLLSLGALCWAAFRLGQWLAGPAAGIVFALILFTRPFLIGQTLLASIETPYLALIVWAAALEVRKPRRGMAVIATLAVAGFIRPEAWVLSGLYWLYLFSGLDWPTRLKLAGVVLIAPVLWMTFDLIATGDALHSLHETRNATEQPDTPRSLGSGLLAGPSYLRNILQLPVVLAGVAGVVIALQRDWRRAIAPLAIALSGVATFLVFGFAGLPLLPRYAFQPAVMLALFASVALVGWIQLRPGMLRRVWAGLAGVVALLIVVFFPLSSLNNVRDQAANLHRNQSELVKLVDSPQFKSARRACPGLVVSNYFDSPLLGYLAGVHARDVDSNGFPDTTRGLLFSSVRSPVPFAYGLPAVDPAYLRVPTDSKRVYGNSAWALYERC